MAVAIVAAVVLVVLRALGSLCLGVVVALVGGPAGDGGDLFSVLDGDLVRSGAAGVLQPANSGSCASKMCGPPTSSRVVQ